MHRFYYGCKGLVEIYLKLLKVAFYNPPYFKSSDISIDISLYFIDAFAFQRSMTWFNFVFRD